MSEKLASRDNLTDRGEAHRSPLFSATRLDTEFTVRASSAEKANEYPLRGIKPEG